NNILPKQLNERSLGIEEMKEEGYRLSHLKYEKERHRYKERLSDCVDALIEGKTDEVKHTIEEVQERMDEIYELLEKEAIDKNYIESKVPSYAQSLQLITTHFE